MNRTESKILRDVIKRVASHNTHAWWELKCQILELGFQTHYPIQDEFRRPAERELLALSQKFLERLRSISDSRFESSPSEKV